MVQAGASALNGAPDHAATCARSRPLPQWKLVARVHRAVHRVFRGVAAAFPTSRVFRTSGVVLWFCVFADLRPPTPTGLTFRRSQSADPRPPTPEHLRSPQYRAVAMPLPCLCLEARPPACRYHAVTMPLPRRHHAIAMSPPCHYQAGASTPGQRHTMSSEHVGRLQSADPRPPTPNSTTHTCMNIYISQDSNP